MDKLFALATVALLATTIPSSAQAPGSYQESCDNIEQRGPYLSAECETINGDTRQTSIDLRGCRGGVANMNGRLTCARRGYGGTYDAPRPHPHFYDPGPSDRSGYDEDD